jgi:hypothetical protein
VHTYKQVLNCNATQAALSVYESLLVDMESNPEHWDDMTRDIHAAQQANDFSTSVQIRNAFLPQFGLLPQRR